MDHGPGPLGLGVAAVLCVTTAACAPVTATTDRAIERADSAVAAGMAREASLDPAAFPPRSVGVLPLDVVSSDPSLAPLGHGLAFLLMTDLARSQDVQVVERLRIDALLRELSLAEAGVVEASGASRAGRILGARYLVVGSLAGGSDDDLRLDARLATTLDATVRPVVSGTASLDEILEAEKTLAFAILEALGVSLTPAERAAIERRPTRNLAALLAFSRGARAESELRLLDALRDYVEAVRLDPAFLQARERFDALETSVLDPYLVAARAIDVINRSDAVPVADVADPAFQSRSGAFLVLPIIIR
jgi:TolB-like protein